MIIVPMNSAREALVMSVSAPVSIMMLTECCTCTSEDEDKWDVHKAETAYSFWAKH